MHDVYQTWQGLLEKHHLLLIELETVLSDERKSLLAHDIDAIQKACAQKLRITDKIELSQKKLDEARLATAQSLELQDTVSLTEIFEKCESEERTLLMKQRQILSAKTKQIAKINQFNSKCLSTYKAYIDGFQHIFNNTKVSFGQTYNAVGRAYHHDQQGRFVSRSF